MKPSPLQLKQLLYTRLTVEPIGQYLNVETAPAYEFDFEGVNFTGSVNTALADGQNDDPRDYVVDLRISFPGEVGKQTPYRVDAGVIGFFQISDLIKKSEREDIVTVNGASLLYSAMREIVASITSRSVFGIMTLPTMNFQDHRSTNKTSTPTTNSSTTK